jgi:phosphoribosylanthranilate isomerase
MTKVKICGITNLDDALLAAHAGADALGFIFYKKSPRYIAPKSAKKIIDVLPPFVQAVGVFVNHSPDEINHICRTTGISIVQEHSDAMSVKDVRKISARVLKVFRVGSDFDVKQAEQFYRQTGVSRFLFDAFHDKLLGGTGVQIDTQRAARIAKNVSKFGYAVFAGGLNAENVQSMVQVVQPYGVDVSSGVEKRVGKKDAKKVRLFIERAKSV